MTPPLLARAARSGTLCTFPRALSPRLQSLRGNRSASSANNTSTRRTSTSDDGARGRGSNDAKPGRQRPVTSKRRKSSRVLPTSKPSIKPPAQPPQPPQPPPGPRLISDPFVPVGLPHLTTIAGKQSQLSEFEEQRRLFAVLDSIRQLHAAVSKVAKTAEQLAKSTNWDFEEYKGSHGEVVQSKEVMRDGEELPKDVATYAPAKETQQQRRKREENEKREQSNVEKRLLIEKERAERAEKNRTRENQAQNDGLEAEEGSQGAELTQIAQQPDNSQEPKEREQQENHKAPDLSNPSSRIIQPIPQYTLLRRANPKTEPLSEHMQTLASEAQTAFLKITPHITDLIQEEYPTRPEITNPNPSSTTNALPWRPALHAQIAALTHTERLSVLRDLQHAEAAALGLYEQKAAMVRSRIVAMAEKAPGRVVREMEKLLVRAEAQEKAVRAVLTGGRRARGVKARRRAAAAVAAAKEAGWGFEGPNVKDDGPRRKMGSGNGVGRLGGIRVGGRRMRLQS